MTDQKDIGATGLTSAKKPDLKQAVAQEPVLRLPDHAKTFEVHTDLCYRKRLDARRPSAGLRRKRHDAERRVTTLSKEMTAVVHCLRTWRHPTLARGSW